MLIDYCWTSKIGDREVNEDAIAIMESDSNICLLVCDGLGGHGHGEVASKLVTKVFKELFDSTTQNTIFDDFLSNAFLKSQQALIEKQQSSRAYFDIKTTGVGVLISQNKVKCAHLGDSRAYLFSEKDILFQTKDHSLVQILVDLKDIKEKDIRNHPERSILLKVLGAEIDDFEADLSKSFLLNDIHAGLLCTDGFWELITEKRMLKYLRKSKNANQWLKMMVEEVKENGNKSDMDNYSAIAWVNKEKD